MLRILLTLAFVFISSNLAVEDCTAGIKECSSKFLNDISNNLNDGVLLCQNAREYVICGTHQNCSQIEEFYLVVNKLLTTQFKDCGFTAEQVIEELNRNPVTTKIPLVIGGQTSTAMSGCLAEIQRSRSDHLKRVAVDPLNTDWVCQQTKIYAANIIGLPVCDFSTAEKREMLITIIQELNDSSVSCPFTADQLFEELGG